MYKYGVRIKKESFTKKFVNKVSSNVLNLGILLAIAAVPVGVFAKNGINAPNPGSPPPAYGVKIATTDMSGTTVSISGMAVINNFLGKENSQYLKISWGDGQATTDLLMNYPTYVKSSGNMTLSKWTATHTYAGDAVNTITASVYRGDVNGSPVSQTEFSSAEVQTESTAAVCADSIDNDKDGSADLNDQDCAKFRSPEITAVLCSDGIDNDLNGSADMNDPSCFSFLPPENTAQLCVDGIDNDKDGFIDGKDSKCAGLTPPENTVATCTDRVDNDLDGMTDGADTECAGLTPPENTAQTCLDAVDNDLDGMVDWEDSDCAAFVVPANCTPGFQQIFVPGVGFVCGPTSGLD